MKRYAEYKDSGIEWIGEIPSEWEIKGFKHCFNTTTGVSITRAELLDVGIDCIGYGPIHSQYGFDLDLERDFVKKAPPNYLSKLSSIAAENDFIFCDTSEDIKGSGNNVYVKNLGGKHLIAGSHTILCHPIEKFHSRFIAYLFATQSWRTQIQQNVFGVKVFSITQKTLKSTSLCLPPLHGQQVIIEHLDRKTAAIDELIADKQKLVALLQEKRRSISSEAVTKGLDKTVEMKNSGIAWIGEIPEGWTLTKFKYFTSKIGSGKTPKGGNEIYVDEGIVFVRSQNVHNTGLSLDDVAYITTDMDKDLANTRLELNDVLLNVTGASIGRSCIWKVEGIQGNVNQHVCIIRSNGNAIPPYIHYVLISNIGQTFIDSCQTGANRQGLNFEQIANFTLPLPKLEEQQTIVTYLDQKTAQIDILISDINEQIEKLKEYRQAVISEAVTGKVAV